jgi:DNA-binding XRE family transcriptional regulator
MKVNKLRVARVIRGLCQHRLAKLVNVSQATISLWELGFREPTSGQKEKISNVLGFKPGELWPEEKESSQGGENA